MCQITCLQFLDASCHLRNFLPFGERAFEARSFTTIWLLYEAYRLKTYIIYLYDMNHNIIMKLLWQNAAKVYCQNRSASNLGICQLMFTTHYSLLAASPLKRWGGLWLLHRISHTCQIHRIDHPLCFIQASLEFLPVKLPGCQNKTMTIFLRPWQSGRGIRMLR